MSVVERGLGSRSGTSATVVEDKYGAVRGPKRGADGGHCTVSLSAKVFRIGSASGTSRIGNFTSVSGCDEVLFSVTGLLQVLQVSLLDCLNQAFDDL